jgi:hypothetical protein
MAKRSKIISGEHPMLGTLYAAVDPEARYVQPKVSELRFAAMLTPYRSAAEAEAALIEAGASLFRSSDNTEQKQSGGAK